MEERPSDKIVRNTIYNVVGRFWRIIISLFLAPYIIGYIGVERYGVWAIVGVLTGYFGLLDFGISTSFVKHISEYYAKKDYQKINQVLNTGFVFYSIFAVLIITSAVLTIHPLLYFFNIPSALHNEARFVFLLGIIIFGVSNAAGAFDAVQTGLQRMDISNKLTIAVSALQITGTIVFLKMGYGLPGLMVNNVIIAVINGAASIIVSFKILPELRFNPILFTKEIFKKLFSFGYKLQIVRASVIFMVQADKLFITYFLSIGLVTFYHLAAVIAETATLVPLLLVSALLPAFSEIAAKGERSKLIDGYTRMTKYLGLIASPLFTLIIISAPQIMTAWMGAGYEKSVLIIQMLGIGWLWSVLGGVRPVVLQAIGKPGIETRVGLIAAILNIPLSIFFIIRFGFAGVALGTSIALCFSVSYGFIKLHQELQIPLGVFIRRTFLKPLVLCLCIGIPIWILATLSQRILFEPTRIRSLLVLTLKTILFLGIYLKALSYMRPLDNIDIIVCKNKMPFIYRLLLRFTK